MVILLVLTAFCLTARAAQPQRPQDTVRLHPIKVHFSLLDPATWPVVPIPFIAVGPTSGQTYGIIPTLLQHGRNGEIVRIIAPDIVHSNDFGWGGHLRILSYPSADSQWSLVASAEQHVQSSLDALYETGLLRESRWSLTVEADYDRSGTARFFGIGNDTPYSAQTVYIDQQLWLQTTLGWNITHAWQLAYTFLAKKVKVIGGHLPGIASLTSRFARVPGIGTTHMLLHRVSLTYDTLNSVSLPTRGVDVILYGGVAARNGSPAHPLFTEAGFDGRFYWSPLDSLTIVTHVDLRYMPTVNAAPFWALSSIGGDSSILGGRQTLRGFVDSRFVDRNSFVANLELRQKLFTLNAFGTRLVLQIAPFVDTGRVFSHGSTFPVDKLHNVVGVGFRGIAQPFVVGYVDVGYGSEGAAVFTGIDYPF